MQRVRRWQRRWRRGGHRDVHRGGILIHGADRVQAVGSVQFGRLAQLTRLVQFGRLTQLTRLVQLRRLDDFGRVVEFGECCLLGDDSHPFERADHDHGDLVNAEIHLTVIPLDR
jgi:hypothetical protein